MEICNLITLFVLIFITFKQSYNIIRIEKGYHSTWGEIFKRIGVINGEIEFIKLELLKIEHEIIKLRGDK